MAVVDLNREELAWAAGFFDGEGYTHSRGVRDRGNQPPLISVSQVDPRSLERLKFAVLGCGKVRGPYGPYGTNKQPFYVWQTSNLPDTIAVAGLLWNWIGPVKRVQMAEAFRLHWNARAKRRQA